jgi:adenylate kinase family enzyme
VNLRSELKKILVFGNSGSGKSTYAKALARRHELTHLDLDSIVWEPGQIAVQRWKEAVAISLSAFIEDHAAWVIEGCYGDLVKAVSAHCTTLIFLNPGLEACLENNRLRPWEPQKYASLEQQNSMLGNLQAWVAEYYERDDAWSYKAHREIFDEYPGLKIEHVQTSAYAL